MMVNNETKILFATINQTESKINTTDTWDTDVKSMGAFFIINPKAEIYDMQVSMSTPDNIQIWSSNLMEVPKGLFDIEGVSEDDKVYISARAIRSEDLEDNYNGTYSVDLEEARDELVKIAPTLEILISGLNEEPVDTDSDEKFNISNVFGAFEFSNDDEYVAEDEDDYDYSNEDKSEDYNNDYDYSNEDETEEYDDYDNSDEYESDDYDEEEDDTINKFINNVFDFTEEEDCVLEEEFDYNNTKALNTEEELLLFCSKHKPYTVKSVIPTHMAGEADYLLERVNDTCAVVTLYNVVARPIVLFEGDNPYLTYEGDSESLLEKIKSLTCRTYGLEEDEFDNMKMRGVVASSYSSNLLEPRNSALEGLHLDANKTVIDILENECTIVHKTSEGEYIVAKCLDIEDSKKDEFYQSLSTLMNTLGVENIEITGYAAFKEVREKLEMHNPGVKLRYSSLGKFLYKKINKCIINTQGSIF